VSARTGPGKALSANVARCDRRNAAFHSSPSGRAEGVEDRVRRLDWKRLEMSPNRRAAFASAWSPARGGAQYYRMFPRRIELSAAVRF